MKEMKSGNYQLTKPSISFTILKVRPRKTLPATALDERYVSMKNITIVMFLALASGGCASDKKVVKEGAPPPAMLAVEVQKDAEIEKYDLNGDKKPDVWKFYNLDGTKDTPNAQRKRILVEKQLDLDFKGKVDMKIRYNKFGAVVSEEMDLDFDGNMDALDTYANGSLVKRVLSMAFKGKPNVWKFFSEGRLTRKERDTNRNGKPDLFEYYEKGKLTRLGYDRDGDGKPDDFDQVSEAAK
jgi:hypothetical protein